jgi:hypothetical protein
VKSHRRLKARCLTAAALIAAAIAIAGPAEAADGNTTSLSGTAGAALQKDGKGLYLHANSHSFELAQFLHGRATRTAVVEEQVAHRLQVNDDIGANGDQTGTVNLVVHPIDSQGRFGPPLASRNMPGDEIKLDSSAGVTVITYGCCAESSAENQLNLNTLKTMYVRSQGAPLTTYTILGKPARGRLIALYLTLTPEDDEVLGKDPSSVGAITLVGEEETFQKIRVHLKDKDARNTAMNWSLEAGWKTAAAQPDNHTVLDPARPTAPIYEWKIDDAHAIEIPLQNDRLNVAAAKLPPGVTLELVTD